MKHEGFKINKESIPTVKLFPKTDIILGYESPIHTFTERIAAEIRMKADEEIWEAVVRTGVVVDKDELIKALKYDRDQYNKGYVNGYNADKWISVEDRLPDNYRAVLVVCESTSISGGRLRAVGSYGGGCWSLSDVDGTHRLTKYMQYVVTHWMELPELPKEVAE